MDLFKESKEIIKNNIIGKMQKEKNKKTNSINFFSFLLLPMIRSLQAINQFAAMFACRSLATRPAPVKEEKKSQNIFD